MTAVDHKMKAPPSTVPIRSLVRAVETWNPSRADGEKIFDYIDLSSVDSDTKVITEARSLSCSEAPSRARQLVAAKDVLVSTVRPNLNGVASVPEELDGATASTGFCVLRRNGEKLNDRYLFHWVTSPDFVASMVKLATGASYPAISDRIILDSKIPLPHENGKPDLDEQKRIAAILDKADAIRRKQQQALRLTDDFLRSVFLDMFGDPVAPSSSAKTMPLEAFVDAERGISYGVVQRRGEVSNGVPVVRINNIVKNRFDSSGIVRTSKEISDSYARTILQGGELLISIRGTIGRIAEVPHSANGWNISREVALIPLKEGLPRQFFKYLILSPGAQDFLSDNTRGVAQRGINLADLRTLPVPVESKSKWAAFDRIVRSTISTSARCESAGLDSEKLFASLQQLAFRGEL